MKKIINIMCLLLAAYLPSQAQNCGSINTVASQPSSGVPGLTPNFLTAACIDSGSYVSDTLYFENYTSIVDSGVNLAVTSLRIDSISNLPAGLCWTTNTTGNQFAGGQTGVIIISGQLQHAFTGQYKLRFIVDLNLNNGTINLTHRDAESLTTYLSPPLCYYLRIKLPGGSCAPLDTNQGSIVVLNSATITPSSHIICSGGTVTLTANSCTACTYSWSNGSTQQSIIVSNGGTYNVTISGSGSVLAANPVTIVNDNALIASFSLSQDSAQANIWHATNTSSGTGSLFYQWSWGDGSGSGDSIISPSHTYASQGVFVVCLRVQDSLGCVVNRCDSTTQTTIPLPSIASINYNGRAICNGQSVTLTASICSGCSYAWSDGSTTQSIQAYGTGPYTVTISDGTHSLVSAPVSLELDTIHISFTLTRDTAMSNEFHAVNTSTGNGLQYGIWYWGDGTSSVDSLQSVAHIFNTSGNNGVCLTEYDTAGCQVSQCDSNVYVNLPLPSTATISPSSFSICNGNAITLSADNCTGCTYAWSNGGVGQQIQVVTAGAYTVTISNSTGSVISAPVTLIADHISASFTLVQDSVVAHHWFIINNCVGNNLSYFWYWGDGTREDSVANPSHTYSYPGQYNICVALRDAAGCLAQYCDSSSYIYRSQAMIGVTVIPGVVNGVANISANAAIQVYPNPSQGILTIETSQKEQELAIIYDALGRSMREVNLVSGTNTVDLRTLSEGVYTIALRDASATAVRFVIAH